MSFFESKYGRTYYISEGEQHKNTPLIGIHGGPGGFHQTILPVLDLKSDRRVILYDQIGTGQSERIERDLWIIDTYTENLNELMDHLGEDNYFLLGASWGCPLILEYCIRYGFERIKGIIFQSPMFNEALWSEDARKLIKGLSEEDQEIIRNCEELGSTESPEYKEAVKHYYSKHLCRDAGAMEYIHQFIHLMNPEIYNHMWGPSEFCASGTLKGYDQTASLYEISKPVLYICGEFDEASPETCRKYSELTANSSLSVLKGAAHMCSHDSPVEYRRLISQFTAEQD